MSNDDLYIGLISGTSVDGVDCALVSFAEPQPRLVASHFKPCDDALRQRVLTLCSGADIDLRLLGHTHVEIGEVFAEAAAELLEQAGVPAHEVAAIGSHGQTVWHQPGGEHPFSLQLGDPNTIAQRSGITTVADLRGRDMAAGGEGAPLAPLLHREVFHSDNVDRCVVNIGGMANITVLPRQGACLAFDTGPGNVLMDYWVGKHRQQRYDENGDWAAQGQFSLSLLNALLDEPYFGKAVPKSTGRELFNGEWLEGKISQCGLQLDPVHVQATLLTFTVTTIVSDLTRYCSPQEVYICGGGVHNTGLMRELGKVASDFSIDSTTTLGVDPDWVEAMAFAMMARKTLRGEAVDTAPFTGATAPVILGGIYQA